MGQQPHQRSFDPSRLDVATFADARGHLVGETPILALARLTDAASKDRAVTGEVHWELEGERRSTHGQGGGIWLRLRARATVALECQRCLAPVDTALDFDRPLRFVEGEAQAAALDADVEEDVLALTQSLDVLELLEDELLLELPLVPRHVVCPSPLPASSAAEAPEADEDTHPFAALQAWKKTGSGDGSAH